MNLGIKVSDLSDEVMKELGEYVHRKWSEFGQSPLRQRKIEDIRKAEKAYEQEPEEGLAELWDGASNLVMPFLTISIDQLEPRLVAALVGRDEVVNVDDFGKADRELAKLVETLSNGVLDSKVDIRNIVRPWVHNIMKRGQVYVQVFWDYEESKQLAFAIDPETGKRKLALAEDGKEHDLPEGTFSLGGYQIMEIVDVVSDGPKIVEVDIENLFFPERVDDWEKAPVVREFYLSWGEYQAYLAAEKDGWVKLDDDMAENIKGSLFSKRPEAGRVLDDKHEEDQAGGEDTDAARNKWELRCLEGHFSYDIDGDGIEERLICTVEEQTKQVLCLKNNAHMDPMNRKQIQMLCMLPDYGTGYGYPLYQKVKAVQRGAAHFVNLLLNSAMLQMLPVTYYEKGAGYKTHEIEVFPGAHIQVADVTKIHPQSFTPNAAAFKDMIQFFLALWERLVVVSDYNIGRQKEGSQNTATGTLALLQEASISHDYMGSVLQGQFQKIIAIIHDLCYLNMGDEEAIRMLGKPMPRMLSKNFGFHLTASTKSANRHVERMELQEAMAAAMTGVQHGLVVPDEPLRDYLGTFKGVAVDRWMDGPLAQLFARIRQNAEQTGEEGEIPDPFSEMVMSMAQKSPEELYAMMSTLQTGKETEEVGEQVGRALGIAEEV